MAVIDRVRELVLPIVEAEGMDRFFRVGEDDDECAVGACVIETEDFSGAVRAPDGVAGDALLTHA